MGGRVAPVGERLVNRGLSRFWTWTRPYRSAYVRGGAWLIATNALALGIPWLLRSAIHDMEAGTTEFARSSHG